MVTHGLYPERELEEVQARAAEQAAGRGRRTATPRRGGDLRPRRPAGGIEAVRAELAELREEVQRLRDLIEKPA